MCRICVLIIAQFLREALPEFVCSKLVGKETLGMVKQGVSRFASTVVLLVSQKNLTFTVGPLHLNRLEATLEGYAPYMHFLAFN